jgi:T-complex protein 1 subunit theta
VISFGGELLLGAQNLLDLGLHASDIVKVNNLIISFLFQYIHSINKGYEKAGKQTLAILDEITNAVANSPSCKNMRSIADVRWAIHTVITTKQLGYVDILSDLIAQACVAVCPQNPTQFNVDHVRSVKVFFDEIFFSS